MKPTRVLPLLVLLPLLPALWAALATEAAPRSSEPVPAPLFVPAPGELSKPLPGLMPRRRLPAQSPATAARLDAPAAPTAGRHWPSDWPSLDVFPTRGAGTAAMQMMGSGDFDIEVPGTAETEERPRAGAVDEFERRPEIAEGRQRREETRQRREMEEAERLRRAAEEFDLTDEERAERRRQEEELRTVLLEVDAEIDEGGDPFGTGPAVPETVADAPTEDDFEMYASEFPDADEETEEVDLADLEGMFDGEDADDERPTNRTIVEAPLPAPVPGYRLTTPDGQPVERVVVGQSFHVELRATPEEASIPGRLGGTRELEFIEVSLISEEGTEQTIRLWREKEPSQDGLIRFVSKVPVSIAATVNGNPLPGTIEGLKLDLRGPEDQLMQTIEIRSRRDLQNGATVMVLYGKPITAAIAEVKDALNTVEEYLRNERHFVEGLLKDAAGDEEVLVELRGWLARIDAQLSVAAEARRLAEHEFNEEYKLVLSSKLLQTLIEQGPNGWEISEANPLLTGHGTLLTFNDLLFLERKQLDEKYRGRAIVQRAAFDVITPYLLTTYSQFAHLTMGAPAFTLVTGLDEFGKEASRVWAAVELAIGAGAMVIAIKLPSSIHSFIDEGRLVPSKRLDFRSSSAGEPLARRPGRLARETAKGEKTLPGAPNRRLPGEAPRAPGRRGGVDAETRKYWHEREFPEGGHMGEAVTPQITNRHLAHMDEAVATARRQGVPDEFINQTLAEARLKSHPQEAAEFVGTRLELEIRTRRGERIYTTALDKTDLAWQGIATAQQLERVQVIDAVTLESVISKAHLEQSGKPQLWTAAEIKMGRSVTRRLEAGEDLSRWRSIDLEWEGGGLRPLFGTDDLGAIRATFTSRPLRVALETPRGTVPRGPAPPAAGPRPAEAGAVREPLRTVERTPPSRTVDQAAPTERVGRQTERVAPPERPAPVDRTERMTPSERQAEIQRTIPRQEPRPREDAFGPLERPGTVNPAVEPTALGGPSGLGSQSRVEAVVRTLGGSTGRVVEAYFANHGEEPVRIQGAGIVLEPVELDEKARVRAEEIMDAASAGKALPPPEPEDDRSARAGVRLGAGPMPLPASWRGARVVRVVLEGYCLELAAGVPTQGTFFRIADRETQADNGTLRAILASSVRLRDQGALRPDGDPEAYFHSVRQWAIWVDENQFDRQAFEVAFIEHVRKNFEAAGREWTAEAEDLLREFIPNRWNDVVAVLEGAGLPVPGGEVERGRSNR